MIKKQYLAALMAVLALTLTAYGCGEKEEKTTATTATAAKSAEEQFGKSAIDLGQSISELRGHYIAAKDLYAEKDYAGAKVHADHPVEELYKSFRQEVAEHNPELDKKVKAALDEAVDLINQKASEAEFNKQVDETSGPLMDEVFKVSQPDVNQNDPLFKAATAAGIITTAAGEYQAAVPKDKLKLVAEYQDSYGFVQYCKLLTEELGDKLGDQQNAISKQIASLNSGPYKSGVNPPKNPYPATDVEKGTSAIASDLKTAFGTPLLVEETDPADELKAIADLLDEALAEYKGGNKQEAKDTASKAYIDHFEELEGPLAEENPELMEQLEKQIGVEIPALIRKGAPTEEISDAIEQVKKELPEAEKALGGTGDSTY